MKRFLLLSVLMLVALIHSEVEATPSSHKMPVMSQESMRCDQGYNDCDPTHCSSVSYNLAWDFNLSSTTGDDDLGFPVLASADGKVVYAKNYKPYESDYWGNCVVVRFSSDAENDYALYAHLEQMFVKVGDSVKQGQVIGSIGKGDGNYLAHLHYQVQNGDNPDAQSVAATFSDLSDITPTSPNSYTSGNRNIFDLEETRYGFTTDERKGNIHWWPGDWDKNDTYENTYARRCYLQDYKVCNESDIIVDPRQATSASAAEISSDPCQYHAI